MKTSRSPLLLNTILMLALAFNIPAGISSAFIPATGFQHEYTQTAALPDFAAFVEQVKNGNASQVTGIYSEGTLALPVVQQPGDQPGYIATTPDTATQFGLAANYGALGFLAHNYLAGSLFYNLTSGAVIAVIYGDGHTQYYIVSQVRHFQAISPNDPYSNFVDVEQGTTLTASDVFFQTYGVAGQAIFQTCIASNGIDSWGRLFVIATPYNVVRMVEKYKISTTVNV